MNINEFGNSSKQHMFYEKTVIKNINIYNYKKKLP